MAGRTLLQCTPAYLKTAEELQLHSKRPMLLDCRAPGGQKTIAFSDLPRRRSFVMAKVILQSRQLLHTLSMASQSCRAKELTPSRRCKNGAVQPCLGTTCLESHRSRCNRARQVNSLQRFKCTWIRKHLTSSSQDFRTDMSGDAPASLPRSAFCRMPTASSPSRRTITCTSSSFKSGQAGQTVPRSMEGQRSQTSNP